MYVSKLEAVVPTGGLSFCLLANKKDLDTKKVFISHKFRTN
jgi:hypothetical protein